MSRTESLIQRYEHPIVLRISGADAAGYLNGRLTTSVKEMSLSSATITCALNPQGKVEAFGSLIKFTAEEYLFIIDEGHPQDIQAAVARYIVADRVAISDESANSSLIHLAGEESSSFLVNCGITPPEDEKASKIDELILLRRRRSLSHGFDILGSKQVVEELVDLLRSRGCTVLSSEQSRLERLKGAVPSFPTEINEKALPLELGLHSAVHLGKGCYVGQEVIEKVDALGRLPRHLERLHLKGDVKVLAGAEVTGHKLSEQSPQNIDTSGSAGTHPVGTVIGSCFDAATNQTYCFAMIKASVPSDAPLFINRELCTRTLVAM